MCLGHDSQFRSPSLTPGTFLDHLYRAISLQTLSQSLFLLSGNSLPPWCGFALVTQILAYLPNFEQSTLFKAAAYQASVHRLQM